MNIITKIFREVKNINIITKIFRIDRCYGCSCKSIVKKKYTLRMFVPKNIVCVIWYCKSCIKEMRNTH